MELGNLFFGNSRGEYPVDRAWQYSFVTKLYDMGFNSYGIPEHEENWYKNKGEFKTIESPYGNSTYFENNTFILMPYYWGDDDVISDLPNFVHKPSGFELSWYKYALRDSYMNKNISFDELMDIMEDCKKSFEVDKEIPYTYLSAIDCINEAIGWLDGTDNKEKTKTVYKKLKEIVSELEEIE